MDTQQTEALQSLRDRIRSVCIHDQAQWEASWKTALSDPSVTGRDLVPPELFFKALEANNVLLGRTASNLLLLRFQESSGVVQAAKFLRWMALGAPADHANPELLFARLPQPYRRIYKVLEHDILDAAWTIISTQSARFKADNFAASTSGGTSTAQTIHSPRAGERHLNDYEAAKKRSCQPTTQLTLTSASQRVVGLVAPSLVSVVVVALDHEVLGADDISSDVSAPSLRILSAGQLQDIGEALIAFPIPDEDLPDVTDHIVTRRSHVRIRGLSTLQPLETAGSKRDELITPTPLSDSPPTSERFLLALHLQRTTITTTAAKTGDDLESEGIKEPPLPPEITMHECVTVYVIETQLTEPRAKEEDGIPPNERLLHASTRLVAVVQPPRDNPETCIAAVALSPDAALLAITWTSSMTIDLYLLPRSDTTDNAKGEQAVEKPADNVNDLVTLSPAFRVDLNVVSASSVKVHDAPILHFLVTPATTAPKESTVRQSLPVHAVVVCHGASARKYLLPPSTDNSESQLVLTPAKTWGHLTRISSSALDATTQFLALGFDDGTLAVWDVIQDVDFVFLPAQLTDESTPTSTLRGEPGVAISAEINSIALCPGGYLVALAAAQQRLFFYDVHERGRPVLLRMVTPPSMPLVTPTHQSSSRSAARGVFMTRLALTNTTTDVPVALVEHSNGLSMIFDVRSAEAIGSFDTRVHGSPTASTTPSSSTASLPTTSASSTSLLEQQTEPRDPARTIAGNLEALYVAIDARTSPGGVNMYTWPDLLLACAPSLSSVLQHRQEELTALSAKQLFVANSAVPPPPSVHAAISPFESLESLLLRMAGLAPTSPTAQQSKPKQPAALGASPSVAALPPAGRSSMTSLASLSDPLVKAQGQRIEPAGSSTLQQPVLPDSQAFFAQYCREDLDPAVMADREARLHRKRRDLLKALAAGGAW